MLEVPLLHLCRRLWTAASTASYTDNQVKTHEPASAQEIKYFLQQSAKVDDTIDLENVAPRQGDLENKEQLALFLNTHCRQCHYSFQVRKCGEEVCPLGVCTAPRLPTDVFKALAWLPDPVIDQARPDHYLPYSDVKGSDTDDTTHPSLQEKASRNRLEEQGCDSSMFTAQRVRLTVNCSECGKPRCLYSRTALSTGDQDRLKMELEQFEYSCGSPVLPPESKLHGTVFVKLAINCSDHVEFAYYSAKLNLHGVCCHCGAEDASKPQALLAKYFVVLPICRVRENKASCHAHAKGWNQAQARLSCAQQLSSYYGYALPASDQTMTYCIVRLRAVSENDFMLTAYNC